jgi:hypothetical protein
MYATVKGIVVRKITCFLVFIHRLVGLLHLSALQPNQHKMLSPEDTIKTSRYGRNKSTLLHLSGIVEYF